MPRTRPSPDPRLELPRLAAGLLRALLPGAERDEVLSELAGERRERRRRSGRLAAGLWLWRQVLASTPALARRGWWRGWSGFETRSERLQPGGAMFESWAIDVKNVLRRLRRRPTYAALAVLTLSLGVAGTAAVWAVADRLLLEPLPVRDEEEVVVFWFEGAWSEAKLAYLRPHVDGFTSLAAFRSADSILRQGDGPARLVSGVSGTAELFDVLGVRPALGVGFEEGSDRLGAEPVAVLSHELWRELGARPSILGEPIELSGVTRTIVGVMPEGFWFPDPTARVWLSEDVDPANDVGNYGILARMPPGATPAAMSGELERIARLLDERFEFVEGWDLTEDPRLIPVRERVLGSVRPALLALLGAMALLLLIACVNVAALMLGQVDSRGTELAVRSALGAGRGRLLQQLVVESLVIGVLAGLTGAALAVVGFRFLVGVLPLGALAEAATLDWRLFGAAIAIAVAAATAVAVAPAISVARSDLRGRLSRSRTGGIGGRGGRLEHALVVGQVALVLLLTAGAALLIRSVENRRGIDPGVELEGVAVVDVQLPEGLGAERIPGLLRELVAALEALPGVESAAATQRLPMRGSSDNWGIGVEDRPDLPETATPFRVVGPDYFRTLGIELRAGRPLLDTDRDPEAAEGAVVVNEAFVRKYFPGQEPLGRRIAFMGGRWDRIVGVVGDVTESELRPEPEPVRYMVHEQVPFLLTWQTLVLRTERGLDPASLLEPARRAVQSAAPGVAVRGLTTLEQVFSRAIGPALQLRSLLAVLAVLALVLGAVGIYGVVSHYVSRRLRDWGIRVTLGLPPARVTGQIVARGGALIAGGIALGLAAFLLLARLLVGFLHGVGTADPAALAGAVAVLLGAGLLAASVPARRASRVDLAKVLREQ